MEITCINCGQMCEVDEEPVPDQHLLCPFCNVKFNYTPQNMTGDNANEQSHSLVTQYEKTTTKIKTSCPHCSTMYEVDAEYIGETVTCGTCDSKFVVTETQTANSQEVRSSGMAIEEVAIKPSESVSDKAKEQDTTTVRRKSLSAFSTKVKTAANEVKDKATLLWRSGWKGRAIILGFTALLVICLFAPFIQNNKIGLYYHNGDGDPKVVAKAAVEESVKCLLDYVRRPNDRRWQALTKSLVSCPADFQDAVRSYITSASKTVDDFISEYTEEDFKKSVKYYYENTVRPGSIVDIDPQFAGLRQLIEADAVTSAIRSRNASIESARFKLKTEIEKSINNLIDIAEKYGIDPIKLEDALL